MSYQHELFTAASAEGRKVKKHRHRLDSKWADLCNLNHYLVDNPDIRSSASSAVNELNRLVAEQQEGGCPNHYLSQIFNDLFLRT